MYRSCCGRENDLQNTYIRVLHAVPNAPAVDVYANGNLIVSNLPYKSKSPYIPVAPGNYNVEVYPAGRRDNPVVRTNLAVPPNTIFNVAAIGTLPNVTLYPIPEPTMLINSGRACIRFVHLSPNAPAVDVSMSDGTQVFNNVGFKDITNYACIPAGTYTFQVRPTGTNNVVLTVPNVKLDPNVFYTIYAVGSVNGRPPLEAILVSEPRRR